MAHHRHAPCALTVHKHGHDGWTSNTHSIAAVSNHAIRTTYFCPAADLRIVAATVPHHMHGCMLRGRCSSSIFNFMIISGQRSITLKHQQRPYLRRLNRSQRRSTPGRVMHPQAHCTGSVPTRCACLMRPGQATLAEKSQHRSSCSATTIAQQACRALPISRPLDCHSVLQIEQPRMGRHAQLGRITPSVRLLRPLQRHDDAVCSTPLLVVAVHCSMLRAPWREPAYQSSVSAALQRQNTMMAATSHRHAYLGGAHWLAAR